MTFERISRRRFVSQSILSSVALTGLTFISTACSTDKGGTDTGEQKKIAQPVDPCEDFSGLTETELTARQKLGYVKVSPIPDSRCQNCQLFLPQKELPACGKCQLFKGPVLTGAYCTYWAPQIPG